MESGSCFIYIYIYIERERERERERESVELVGLKIGILEQRKCFILCIFSCIFFIQMMARVNTSLKF